MARYWTNRLVWLLIGLFLYGIATAAMVNASVGVTSWTVLTEGLNRVTGLSFGLLTNLIGVLVLGIWPMLRQRLGLGTILNVLLVGPSAEVGLHVIPHPSAWLEQCALFAAGLVLLALATGIYIAPGLGTGPRDGLMTGIHARFGGPLWAVRAGIELSVLVVGWVLGGQVGLGTVAGALLIGPLIHRTLPFFERAYAARPVRLPRTAGVGAAVTCEE